MRRVVVTGYGAISPIGKTAPKNWESLTSGLSGVRRVTLFDTKDYACKIAGEISDFDPKEFISTKDMRKMDRFIQFSLVASHEAVAHSGLEFTDELRSRSGAYVGVGIGGLKTIEDEHKEILNKGPRRVTPFFIPMIIPNLAAAQIAMRYGLQGPNLCTTTACSASAHAIGESMRNIQRGETDVMISGGAEAVICALGFAGFSAARALSLRNDDPEHASRPFDKNRDGFVMGEGSAILVLEEYEHAKKRGAKIHAELLGYAANCDAYHMTQPTPNGAGPAECMRRALKDAKLSPQEIGYINAHGTSTPLGDIAETQAIKTVFGADAKKVPVSSTKSMTGHLLGAAGALESMFSVQALENQILPPTINLLEPDPECDLDYVPNKPRPTKMTKAMSNSFGFGGTNATLIFGKV